ncbi:hypothetical protein K438DRAFT_1767712 [Mycena galopus ATCC 62051]|nr:hypothetical protein K438DRAFT_1767712 [Mycena galopus ATCC 62051]
MAIGCPFDFARHQPVSQKLMAPGIAVYTEECQSAVNADIFSFLHARYTSLLMEFTTTDEGTVVRMPAADANQCASRCRITRYCSRDCQASHWAVHRQICAKRGLAFSQQMEDPEQARVSELYQRWHAHWQKSIFWVVLRERADRHGARDAYEVVYSDMHADIDIEATLAHLGGVTMFQAMPRSPTCIRWAVTCQGPCGPSGCDFLHTDRLMLTQRPDLVAALRDTTSQAAKMTALELRSDWESFFKSSVQQGARNYIHPLCSHLF